MHLHGRELDHLAFYEVKADTMLTKNEAAQLCEDLVGIISSAEAGAVLQDDINGFEARWHHFIGTITQKLTKVGGRIELTCLQVCQTFITKDQCPSLL